MTQDLLSSAEKLLHQSLRRNGAQHSLYRTLNGTMRERLTSLTRKCRYATQRLEALEIGMNLIGCTYNWCFAHHELSLTKHFDFPCTPAMASGLNDHVWSNGEVLTYKLTPAPWAAPKRSHKKTRNDPTLPKRPQGRPRIHPLPDPALPKRLQIAP